MPKVLFNLKRGTDLTKAKKDDILIYDNVDKTFYLMSADVFFKKYEEKLNNLLNRYDKKYNDISKEVKNYKSETDKDVKTLKADYTSFATQIKDSNSKLIDMVETFIKESDK